MSSTTALDVNKYANNVLNNFNEKHHTDFTCVLGINEHEYAQSFLNKKTRIIRIDLPKSCLDTQENDKISAVKILLGHELSHHIYKNMSLSSLDVLTMCTNRIAGQYRKLIMSCCIEVAADIHGRNMFNTYEKEVTEEVYKEYKTLIQGGLSEDERGIVSGLKIGYLPASYRVKIMKETTTFQHDNYKVVDDICDDIAYISEKYMGKKMEVYKYIDWIKLQMQLDNFPNRPNRHN